MTGFAIRFDRPLPPVRIASRPQMSHAVLYEAAEAAGLPELDPQYVVAGQVFGYYPAHVTTVLDDMEAEADLFARRLDHGMDLCGYTVLLVEFRDGQAIFRDPSGSAVHGGEVVGEGYDPDEIAEAFRCAADAVWALIFPGDAGQGG